MGRGGRKRRAREQVKGAGGAKRHTKHRAHERFGLKLTQSDITKIKKAIAARRGDRVALLEGTRELWLVPHGEERLPVVYDRRGRMIVTVLPLDHELVVQHVGRVDPAADAMKDGRLDDLREVARILNLPDGPQELEVVGPIRIGERARHEPTNLEGKVLDACMSTRTITIRVGETGQLRDRHTAFSGPALSTR